MLCYAVIRAWQFSRLCWLRVEVCGLASGAHACRCWQVWLLGGAPGIAAFYLLVAKGVVSVLGGGCRVCVQKQRKVLVGFGVSLSQAVQGSLLAA